MGRWFLKLIFTGLFSVSLAVFIRSEQFSTYVVLPLLGEDAAKVDPLDAIPVLLEKLAEDVQTAEPAEELEPLETDPGRVTVTTTTQGGSGKQIRINN